MKIVLSYSEDKFWGKLSIFNEDLGVDNMTVFVTILRFALIVEIVMTLITIMTTLMKLQSNRDDLDHGIDGSICSSRHSEGEKELCKGQTPRVNLQILSL